MASTKQLDHRVPSTTLNNRINGKVQHGLKPGPRPFLNRTEDRKLGVFLKECAGIGYGKTRRDVTQSVAEDKRVLKRIV